MPTPAVLSRRAIELGLNLPIATVTSVLEAREAFDHALPIICIGRCHAVVVGRPDWYSAPATIAAIDQAVKAVALGDASAVVTNPIAKAVLYEAGFRFPGHTEYLAHLAQEAAADGRKIQPVMMLACDELKVVPTTIHIPLALVPTALTKPLLKETLQITLNALRSDFGIAQPRIAVAGLNPHAGENGAIGTEDRDLIAPVIAELVAAGQDVTGPHPADTLFHAAARRRYDAVVAMYHDQALIPIKTLAFDTGVNITLGLPFVRTSPDHGTAFDIAGSGRASAESLIQALLMAHRMVVSPTRKMAST